MTQQHSNPCKDCPWARWSIQGWTGQLTPQQWIEAAHGETTAECHIKLKDLHCAGLAIYRSNVFKIPRDPKAFKLPADRAAVFSSPEQFLEHHRAGNYSRGSPLERLPDRPGTPDL